MQLLLQQNGEWDGRHEKLWAVVVVVVKLKQTWCHPTANFVQNPGKGEQTQTHAKRGVQRGGMQLATELDDR